MRSSPSYEGEKRSVVKMVVLIQRKVLGILISARKAFRDLFRDLAKHGIFVCDTHGFVINK